MSNSMISSRVPSSTEAPMIRTLALTALCALALLASCAERTSPTGGALFGARFPTNLATASDVTSVTVVVTGPELAQPVVSTLSKNSNGIEWDSSIVGLPPTGVGTNSDQPLTFSAVGFNSQGNRIFSGSASADIVAGQSTVVMIVLQEVNPTPGVTEYAPIIESIIASAPTVDALGTEQIQAAAYSPLNKPLAYQWTASAGAFGSPTALSTSWTAPVDPGPVTLTLTVSDNGGAAPQLFTSESIVLTVLPTSGGNVGVQATFNQSPVVTLINVSNPRPKDGDSITLTATVTDGDSDPTQVTWSTSCGNSTYGSFAASAFDPSGTTAQGASATWTVSSTLGGEVECWFYATAIDLYSDGGAKGGTDTGQLLLSVGPSLQAQYTPVIDSTSVSAADTGSSSAEYFGYPVNLSINAHLVGDDPASPNYLQDVLYANWRTNSGSISVPGAFNQAQWIPGGCTATPAQAQVDIVDRNNGALYDTYTFHLDTCAPTSCNQLRNQHPEGIGTAVYAIDPDGVGSNTPFYVYCDFEANGGGWQAVAVFTTNFLMTQNFNLLTTTPDLIQNVGWYVPASGTINGTDLEEHFDLRLFDSYTHGHTFRLTTAPGYAFSEEGEEQTFFRTNSAVCTESNPCLPSDAASNWYGSQVHTHYELLNFSYYNFYNANDTQNLWVNHTFDTWIDTPAWTTSGAASGLNVLFGYHNATLPSAGLNPACASASNCPCTDNGETVQCIQSAGALVSGTFSGTWASTSMEEPPAVFPLTAGQAQTVVLWLRDESVGSIVRP